MGQYSIVWYGVAQYGTTWCNLAQHGTAWHGLAQHSLAQPGPPWHSARWRLHPQCQAGPGQAQGHPPCACHGPWPGDLPWGWCPQNAGGRQGPKPVSAGRVGGWRCCPGTATTVPSLEQEPTGSQGSLSLSLSPSLSCPCPRQEVTGEGQSRAVPGRGNGTAAAAGAV